MPEERILIVEEDPEISDLIAHQSLEPMGFRVEIVRDAASAVLAAVRFSPDLIITNLKLPDLSGKDLLVALNSQGIAAPVIVISSKGMEEDVIQAFRLGAGDYLHFPMREAEIVAVVERALKQVRARHEREALARQLNETNRELQLRVRELTTIFAIGKAVTSVTDTHALFEKIVEGAVYVTEADCGWLLTRQEKGKQYILSAQRNLPKSLHERLNHVWDDGISSLVGLSGEPLSIHGEPLKRFKIARLGNSALVMPVKVKSQVVGLLTVLRKSPRPFGPGNQALLEAVADYASISLVNALLFRALEERARSLQAAVEMSNSRQAKIENQFEAIRQQVHEPLDLAGANISSILVGEEARLNAMQKNLLRNIYENIQKAGQVLDSASLNSVKES